MIGGRLKEAYRRRFRTGPPCIAPELQTPKPCNGTVVLTGFGTYGFEGYGKVDTRVFFPPFVYTLFKAGIRCVFWGRESRLTRPDTVGHVCVIHIYSEEVNVNDNFYRRIAPLPADIVFNEPQTGKILGRKDLTNAILGRAGISVPRLVKRASYNGGTVFSNAATGSHERVCLIDRTDDLDDGRYNTEFIETRREYRGALYYATVRLLSVGREIVHAFARMRPDIDGSPSVHAGDMPLEPKLVEYFQKILVDNRKEELIDLSGRLSDALGLGFFVHDLIISSESEQIYVCESGFKFNDMSFRGRLLPIAPYIPSHAVMFSPEVARRSAEGLLKECKRNGCFL